MFQRMALRVTLGLVGKGIPHGDRRLGLLVSIFVFGFLGMGFQRDLVVSMMSLVMVRTRCMCQLRVKG